MFKNIAVDGKLLQANGLVSVDIIDVKKGINKILVHSISFVMSVIVKCVRIMKTQISSHVRGHWIRPFSRICKKTEAISLVIDYFDPVS